jgi:hypothetical protein
MLNETLTQMPSGLNDFANLSRRISRLERQNGRLRKVCWLDVAVSRLRSCHGTKEPGTDSC